MSWLGNLMGALNVRPTAPSSATESAPEAPPAAPTDAPYAAYEALLALREGRRNVVYKDSLGKPTVGIGHLVRPEDGMKVGDKVTDAQVDTFFQKDGRGAWEAATAQAQQAGITSPDFLPYLASVCFQLGNAWTGKFPNTWKMIVSGQYARAAGALNGTVWQKQTPVRVKDFQEALTKLPPKG